MPGVPDILGADVYDALGPLELRGPGRGPIDPGLASQQDCLATGKIRNEQPGATANLDVAKRVVVPVACIIRKGKRAVRILAEDAGQSSPPSPNMLF